MALASLINSKKSICPEFMVPFKTFIVQKKESLCQIFFETPTPWKTFSLDVNWTTWSPPDELFNQFLEWEPLSNINYMASVLSSFYPQLSFYFLFFLTLTSLMFMFFSSLMFSHMIELSKKRDYELKFMFSITQKIKLLFPSPNHSQEAKQNGFGPFLGNFIPLPY